jgi:hypothetical protein
VQEALENATDQDYRSGGAKLCCCISAADAFGVFSSAAGQRLLKACTKGAGDRHRPGLPVK